MTSAWRVVSLRYGSTLSMKSTPSSARLSRSPSGADSTGLPAMVITALIWPSPGVSISSASAAAGSSDRASGWPETRLCQRPVRKPRPGRGGRGADAVGESGNMAPPGRSRLPVRMLRTSTSQLARVPNSTVDVPIRPYTAAVGAAASSRASVRISSAATPQCAATASGGKSGRQRRDLVDADDVFGQSAESEVDEALVEEHVHDREQQRGVGAGPGREVPVGQLGGAGAARVDDGQPAAAPAQRLELAAGSRPRWPGCRWRPAGWRR